jgi:predicted enzyme related to lactoylglutathione lyase
MKNAISWFEIPALDYQRAKAFYNTVLAIEIMDMPMPEGAYGFLPFDQENGGIGGGLIQAKGQVPSSQGCTLYLDGGDDLSIPLSRVEAAGGKILVPKTGIGENGFFAQFMDTEGNRMALHSPS